MRKDTEQLAFFILGMSYNLNLFPEYNLPEEVCLKVEDAMYRNWLAVGDNLKYAIEHYECKKKEISSQQAK